MLADVVLSVQGLISQSIIDTLKSAIQSGNIGGLQVEIALGTNIDQFSVAALHPVIILRPVSMNSNFEAGICIIIE